MTQKKTCTLKQPPFLDALDCFFSKFTKPTTDIPTSSSCVWLEDAEKNMSENPVDLWCVHHFLGFIPTHVILKNMQTCILKNSPTIEILLPTKPIFEAAKTMFLTKKPFTCFLKAIMRASPTKAKYSWQEINNSNQLSISCLLRWHLFVFLGKQFWISISLKGLFSRNVEFLSTHSNKLQ